MLPDAAYYRGHGANAVNVLLVDIRAWDTMGEISVLLVAATGVASMVFRHRRFGAAPRVADAGQPDNGRLYSAAENSPAVGDVTWLRGSELRDPRHRSLVLEVATRIIFPLIMVLSAYFFFAGHNTPGGGFAGGLTAGLALVLRYLAGGRYELGETLPLDAGKILGAGLFLSAGTAVASLLAGAPVLSSALIEIDVPVLGTVKFVTALFFDLGVYLIVVGLVLDVLRSLGARIDVEMGKAVVGAMTAYLVPLVLIGGLTSAGVYLLLERNLTRMLLGLLLIGNAINLLILTVGGPSGNPPIRGRTSNGETTTADPLAQGMILTAIVISLGIAAFVLAMTYRSYRLTTEEEVSNDLEDTRVSEMAATDSTAIDEDRLRPEAARDTDLPDELDALPGLEGSR